MTFQMLVIRAWGSRSQLQALLVWAGFISEYRYEANDLCRSSCTKGTQELKNESPGGTETDASQPKNPSQFLGQIRCPFTPFGNVGLQFGLTGTNKRFDRVLLHKPRRLWLRQSFDNHKCFLIRSRESCFRKCWPNKAGAKEWAHFHNITNQKIMTEYLRFHVVPANYQCRADVSNKVLRWQRTGSWIHLTTRLKMITSQDCSIIFLYYTVHYLQYEKASTSLPPSNYFNKEQKIPQ